jgi:CRP-like cAMP-binding protein
MDELFHYLESLYPLSPEIRAALVTRTHKESHRKNKTILSTGQFCDWIAFIEHGLVKVCYDIPGDYERIITIHRPNEIACAIKSYNTNLPSKVSMVALDDTVIRKIRKIEAEAICEKYPAFNIHLRKIIEKQSILIEDHYILLTLPPRERFEKMEEEHSWMINDKRIRNYMIADYLGIDKGTFSRIWNGR